MIRYTKGGRVRIHQSREPQHPFWQATTIHPYSPDVRSSPIGIDWVRLRGHARTTVDVSIPESLEGIDLDRLPSPILIDAHGAQEIIYRLGDKLMHELSADARPMVLLSSNGDLPRGIAAAAPIAVVTAWPVDLIALDGIGESAAQEDIVWGILVPVIFPITTDLTLLRQIAEIAERRGARFLASASIELEAKAKRAVAEMMEDLDEETWATLFDSNLDPVQIATERHIASLAHARGIGDSIDPWLADGGSNRAAAAFLSRVGSRMVRMEHDIELGWMFLKASRRIATLDKELTRLAGTAHVTIIPELADEIVAEVVEQWLELGRAEFADHIDEKWRLARA